MTTPEQFKRPCRTSMEGMIWNANHVLEQALSPRFNGVPKKLFKDCRGIVIISVVEVGLIFSGNRGTGILLKKTSDTAWSPPAAVGLTGIGFGFLVGLSVKDVIVFLMDDLTVQSFSMSSKGLKLGVQAELTVGPFGRGTQSDSEFTGQGLGSTVAVAFTKGAFAGVNFDGAVIGSRAAVNKAFYGRAVAPTEILNAEHGIIPSDKLTLLDDVYHKLELLALGKTLEHDTVTAEKKAAAAEVAEKASEQVNAEAGDDVVPVDAQAEAAKEEEATK